MAQAMTEGVYGRTMQKCPDPAEKCLPLGEGGFAKQRRMRGGRGYQCSTVQSLPLGVVPRAANRNIHDCRWQSYHS